MRAIDLFAGWGGFTTGAVAAGVSVVWAGNHDPRAVDAHARNHPTTIHVCQDLRQADWSQLPRYDLLLAAPACQGHSSASQPNRRAYHDAMRATAWAVIDCADVTEPLAIAVENVPAFLRWRLFPVWREALARLGYHVAETIVRASHHGVPQRRDRLFITATRKARPGLLDFAATTEPAFGPCIEWDAPGWRSVGSARGGSRARIAAALDRRRRSLVQHVTGHQGVGLDEPIRTITTKDQWIVVDGDRYRPLSMREIARGMGFPESYTWAPELARNVVVLGFGNAICPPVGRAVVSRLADAA